MKDLVILVQLGSPQSPSVKDVRRYLQNFLGDPRVVDLPQWLWKMILFLFILPFRPKRSTQAYARIWDPKQNSFPLVFWTKRFAEKVRAHLITKNTLNDQIEVIETFILGSPNIKEILGNRNFDFSEQLRKVVVIPLFPQYSESTSASVWDMLSHSLAPKANIPRIEFVNTFHRAKSFIDGQAQIIAETIKRTQEWNAPLLVSFHGLPLRRVVQKKDRYFYDCAETFVLLEQELRRQLPDYRGQLHFCFQSRFGSEPWLGPATDELAFELVGQGHKYLYAVCPSFVADCLETVDEIGHELQKEVEERRGHLEFIPCLNDRDTWARGFAQLIESYLKSGGPDLCDLEYSPVPVAQLEKIMPAQKKLPTPIDQNAKSTLKIIFLILFLDLVGFSIIFPLFPAMMKYYLEVDGSNSVLMMMANWAQELSPENTSRQVVLFGGILGALYSFLQFIAAPFWGQLSDKIGRKPVLMISLCGLLASYMIWFFSGNFTLLFVSRIFSGLMAGNISTASAVVADVTSEENRSRAMATIGIAFALGFILGPAIGGISSLWDLSAWAQSIGLVGVNPFSLPALMSMLMSLVALILVLTRFKETFRPGTVSHISQRSLNPIALFRPLPWPEVNLTILSHFFFLALFSGMEFTLTFLAAERFGFGPAQNAKIFVFVGLVLTLVQGGYVRRKAHQVGEKKMAIQGMLFVIPGLVILAWANSVAWLYFGLTFLAIGSGMAIPCFSSLVSLLTPPESQGKSMGMFRSLGALARVFGPITASLVYWKGGSMVPYLFGGIAMVVPLLLLSKLRKRS